MSTSSADPDETSSLALSGPTSDFLEPYMTKSYNDCTPDSPRSFFRNAASSPRLVRGRINRVLVHRGCFNPPHIAHLNLLRYVYLQAHVEFDIVAAIIVLLPDSSCRNKLDGTDDKLLFTFEERKNLWEQDTEFPDWACVVDNDKWDGEETSIINSLRNNVSKEGYGLKLVNLIGPDYVTYARGASNGSNWELMTSDVGRPVDFLGTDGLLQLPNCSPWKKLGTLGENESSHSEKEPLSGSRNVANSSLKEYEGGVPTEHKPRSLDESFEEPKPGQTNLCQRKPEWKRSSGMFRGINGKSKEYLRGCFSGILKTFPARWKTSHEGQDYQNSLAHLFAEKISLSTSIAIPPAKEHPQKHPFDGKSSEAMVPTKMPITSSKAETSAEDVPTPPNAYSISSSEISDRTNQTRYCFPEIHHCRIRQSSNLFFIPAAADSEYRKYTSSTEIRKIMEMNTSHPKEITEELASMVLGPQRKVSLEGEQVGW